MRRPYEPAALNYPSRHPKYHVGETKGCWKSATSYRSTNSRTAFVLEGAGAYCSSSLYQSSFFLCSHVSRFASLCKTRARSMTSFGTYGSFFKKCQTLNARAVKLDWDSGTYEKHSCMTKANRLAWLSHGLNKNPASF